MARPDPTFEAARISKIRRLLPTTLGSAGVRARIAADIRARSVFVSRCTSEIFLGEVKRVVDAIVAGDMDEASGRAILVQVLRDLGYTPEGGFPEFTPDGSPSKPKVPPALKGTLQDISSKRRLDLIIRTQVDLMRGASQKQRGMQPERYRLFPAWELVRVQPRTAPRNWDHWLSEKSQFADPRPRWIIAGGTFVDGSRMIAFKGDPIWGELGGSANFDDALDVDYPPFAFQSGMGWREVPRDEVIALGITGPGGETIDEWQRSAQPVLNGETPALPPPPVIDIRDVPEDAVDEIVKDTGATVVDGKITTSADKDAIRKQLAERKAAREARRKERVERAVKRATQGGGA